MFNNAQRGANMPQTILRLPATRAETGYSRSTIYLRISQGLFVKPISLGPRAVGFPAAEVASINAARIAGRTDNEIRALVTSLEAARVRADQKAVA
jgi:prophage regulatory protein